MITDNKPFIICHHVQHHKKKKKHGDASKDKAKKTSLAIERRRR
jgi:hypothetical protein